MKISTIEKALQETFLPEGSRLTVKTAQKANLVLFQLLRAPYFEHTLDRHLLQECTDDFYRIFVKDNDGGRFYDVFQDHYQNNDNSQGLKLPVPTSDIFQSRIWVIPQALLPLAKEALNDFLKARPEFEVLFKVDEKRYDITIEEVQGNEALDERLAEILGENYNLRLNRYGIDYHNPSLHKKTPWVYFLAHNGDEIAGILGAYPYEQNLNVPYVSVAEGFRERGLANQLISRVIDYAQHEERFIKRSQPSPFCQENPKITDGFDALFLNSQVPHISRADRLEGALVRLRNRCDWSDFVQHAKPICDQWLRLHPTYLGNSSEHREQERDLVQLLDQTLPLSSPRPLKMS